MLRLILTAFAGIVLSMCHAPAQDSSGPAVALDKAKAAYAEDEKKAKATLLDAFAEAEKVLAKAADLDGIKAVRAEKTAFEESGTPPASAKMKAAATEYQRAVKKSAESLNAAYEQAVKGYTTTLDIDKADATKAEWLKWKAQLVTGPAAVKEVKGPLKPQAVATKADLQKYLAGSEWQWDREHVLKLNANGGTSQSGWEAGNLVTRWETIDRRTVLLVIEQGRDHNRLSVMKFSENLTEFDGYDFSGKALEKKYRKAGK